MTNLQTKSGGYDEYNEYDAIIVGGSFAGLSAAMQLARARRKILVIDAGKPRNRFARAAHGFLAQDGQTPQTILDTARKQLLAYPTVRFLTGEATNAIREKDRFRVSVAALGTKTIIGKRLILATGVVDHLPEIPGLRELWGTGVMHCPYCHGYEVADRNLAVLSIGGKSVHQALLLRDWSENVTLLTNGEQRPTEEEQERLKERGVSMIESPVVRLIAKGADLEAITFAEGKTLSFGGLFTASRTSFASPIAEQLGCESEEGMLGPILKTDSFKETTISGVFAAGDAARAMQNIAGAVGDGAIAGTVAHQSLIFR
jgi:thioredoxin reductase